MQVWTLLWACFFAAELCSGAPTIMCPARVELEPPRPWLCYALATAKQTLWNIFHGVFLLEPLQGAGGWQLQPEL